MSSRSRTTVTTPRLSREAGRRVVDQGKEAFDDIDAAKAKLERLAGLTTKDRNIQVTISWRIDEETTRE